MFAYLSVCVCLFVPKPAFLGGSQGHLLFFFACAEEDKDDDNDDNNDINESNNNNKQQPQRKPPRKLTINKVFTSNIFFNIYK